ncbi:pectate lyase, partial [Streptomyces sp. TRM76130]|nr:pectate lyase [Streptomyces sp. TRM76130]
GADGATWSDTRHDYCEQQRRLRQTGSNNEKAQIQLTVESNTTLVGTGDGASLLGVFLTVNTGTNIVVRNLRL